MEDLSYLKVYAASALSKCGGFILIQLGITNMHAPSNASKPEWKSVISCALDLRFLNAFARANFIENRRGASYEEAVNIII